MTHLLPSSKGKKGRVLHLPTFSFCQRRWKASMINNCLLTSTRRITHQFTSVADRNAGLLPACLVRTSTGVWKAVECWGTSLAAGPNRKKTAHNSYQNLTFFVHQNKTLKHLIYLPNEIFQVAYNKNVPPQPFLREAKDLKG